MSAAIAEPAKASEAATLSNSFFIGIPHSRRLRDQPTNWLQFGCSAAKQEAWCRKCDTGNQPLSLLSLRANRPDSGRFPLVIWSNRADRGFTAPRNVMSVKMSQASALHLFQIGKRRINRA